MINKECAGYNYSTTILHSCSIVIVLYHQTATMYIFIPTHMVCDDSFLLSFAFHATPSIATAAVPRLLCSPTPTHFLFASFKVCGMSMSIRD